MAFCSFYSAEKYRDVFVSGVYVCAKCGYELFSSKTKYKHSTPWPAFTEPLHEDSISKKLESPDVYKVRCGKCGNGLGHEFVKDGPSKNLSRFWIFSDSLKLIPNK